MQMKTCTWPYALGSHHPSAGSPATSGKRQWFLAKKLGMQQPQALAVCISVADANAEVRCCTVPATVRSRSVDLQRGYLREYVQRLLLHRRVRFRKTVKNRGT